MVQRRLQVSLKHEWWQLTGSREPECVLCGMRLSWPGSREGCPSAASADPAALGQPSLALASGSRPSTSSGYFHMRSGICYAATMPTKVSEVNDLIEAALFEAEELPGTGGEQCGGAKRALLMLGEASRAITGSRRERALPPFDRELSKQKQQQLRRLHAATARVWARVDCACRRQKCLPPRSS